jgi:formimidoylglutamate deiminase
VSDGRSRTLEAELTWTGTGFEPGVRLQVDAAGRLAAVTRGQAAPSAAGREEPVTRLPRRALLPGFVNAHSHAFQRGLRGRGETFPAGAGDFWSWREEMYGLVSRLTEERLYELCLAAFREMRAAGVTAVGEFHYLHHRDADGLDFAFDDVVLAAAAAAPIRVVLLEVFYATGGIGEPLVGAQRRFATPSPAAYWRQVDRLAGRLAADGSQTLGAVAHSIRAATPAQIAELHTEARRRGMPFHMHVEEQRREIAACRSAYGASPMALLLDALEISDAFTAVHCTHTAPDDLERFTAAGGNVCVCPLTEANLGDGIPPLAAVTAARHRLCLGSDSNARISMLEEARWLEYAQRLAGEGRGVLRDETGNLGPVLLAAATAHGARALGLDAGEIAAGRWADLVAVDLDHPSRAGAEADTLLDALLLGAADGAVAASCVGGRWLESAG